MGLFKRLAGLLGFARDEDQLHQDDGAADTAIPVSYVQAGVAKAAIASAQHLPRRGFSVPVQVPVERAPISLLVLCPAGDGGLQVIKVNRRGRESNLHQNQIFIDHEEIEEIHEEDEDD